MILYCLTNRDLEVWHLDLTGALARPPASPVIYALVSFEAEAPRYYVGSSKRFSARMSAHLSFARSRKLHGHSAGGQFLGPVVSRRRRVLVIILETCAGADTRSLQRCEQAWFIVAQRDNGTAALPYQVPGTTAPLRGPHAPATLAARRRWPCAWVAALAGFFREPRSAQPHPMLRPRLNGAGKAPATTKPAARRRRPTPASGRAPEAGR